MKTYKVVWTQNHMATVQARNKEDAALIAQCMHDRDTLVKVRDVNTSEVIR